jgi:hypothetical protein
MIICHQLLRPFWNNPLWRGTQLFASSFLGNFVHFVDRDIVNEASGSADMLLTRAIIWPETAVGTSRSTINLWTVIKFYRSSFHD